MKLVSRYSTVQYVLNLRLVGHRRKYRYRRLAVASSAAALSSAPGISSVATRPILARARGEVDEIFKRQNRMRASVSRLLKRSVLLIANVEQGIFPSFKPIKPLERARFSKRQLEMHQSIEVQWWSLDLTSSLSAGKIDEARRVHYEEEQRTRQSSITQKRERVIKYS